MLNLRMNLHIFLIMLVFTVYPQQIDTTMEDLFDISDYPDFSIPLPLEDFRGCPWGCAVEHVQKKETADIIRGNTENLLFYYTELYGHPTYMAYVFNEKGRLYKGKYYFINKTDYHGYLKDYEKLRTCLIKQYGDPYEVEESYTGAFYITWGVPRTFITLGLLGDSNSINLSLEYMKKEDTDRIAEIKKRIAETKKREKVTLIIEKLMF